MSPYASVGLIDGWFWSKDTGFITGQNGGNSVILHTVDGGATWQTVYSATRNDTDHVWKIFFPSRNIGYGSIEYTGNLMYRGNYKTYFVKPQMEVKHGLSTLLLIIMMKKVADLLMIPLVG
jgi:hypothetical protein